MALLRFSSPQGAFITGDCKQIAEDKAMTDWTKDGWRKKPRIQMPEYLDAEALNAVEAQPEPVRETLIKVIGTARFSRS